MNFTLIGFIVFVSLAMFGAHGMFTAPHRKQPWYAAMVVVAIIGLIFLPTPEPTPVPTRTEATP